MSCECCCIDIKVVLEDETIDVPFEFGEPVDRLVKPDAYTGPVAITPTDEQQTLQTADKLVKSDISVNPIPSEYIVPTGNMEITENGQYDVTAKASVIVDVPAPAPTGTIEITENGTYDVTDKALAQVNVPIPQPAGTKEILISENGIVTEDVSDFASVEISVDVPTAPVEPDYDDVTLPAEYQRVEYIESTGSQYIDLPFGFDPTDEICSVLLVPTGTSSEHWLVAPRSWNTNKNRFCFAGVQGAHYGIGYGQAGTNGTVLQYYYANDGAFHKHTYKDYLFAIKEVNAYLGGVNRIVFGGTTANLRLFYGYRYGTAGKIRYYVHKKADGTSVVLYACYRKADGVIGMYDIANDIFYTNSGTGTFAKGADI